MQDRVAVDNLTHSDPGQGKARHDEIGSQGREGGALLQHHPPAETTILGAAGQQEKASTAPALTYLAIR